MAPSASPSGIDFPLGLALGLALACGCATVRADPMRPIGGAPAAAPAPTAAVPRAAAASEAPPPRLLATRRDANGNWQALVARQWLGTGDRIGPATVREVRADRLVLQQGTRNETLHLLPPLTPFVSRFETAPEPRATTPEPRTRSAAL